MSIIAAIPDEERLLMRKEAQQTGDKNHARRLIAILMLQGMTVTDVARMLCAARSSVGRWINWFTLHGAEGLKTLKAGLA